MVLFFIGLHAQAYDIVVENKDGEAIYYDIDGNDLQVTNNGENSYGGDLVIPAQVLYKGKTYNVTSIGKKAFYNCYRLTSITIPNTVTSIGEKAFSQCRLTTITIPNSVTNIGEGAFLWCIDLTSITIPNSIKSIGEDAFEGCPGSPSIGNSSTSSAEETLNLYIYAGNLVLPNSYSDGMVNTEIVREGDYVVYYFICDEPKYDIDRMQKNISVLKNKVLEVVNSDMLAPLREVCRNAGVGIGYYYVGKESGKIAKVLMPVDELAE